MQKVFLFRSIFLYQKKKERKRTTQQILLLGVSIDICINAFCTVTFSQHEFRLKEKEKNHRYTCVMIEKSNKKTSVILDGSLELNRKLFQTKCSHRTDGNKRETRLEVRINQN